MKSLILSIETSGANCSVCLSSNGDTIALYSANGRNIHDKLLAEFTNRIFSDFEIGVDNLSAVAVSIGPGSFTGLRIGVSFAKGLCFGGNPKLIAVPTLTAQVVKQLKYLELTKKEKLISIINSHKDIFYYQIFDMNLDSISEIEMANAEELNKIITENMLVISNLQTISNISQPIIKAELNAESVSLIAHKLFNSEKFVDDEELIPLYVQDFVPLNHKKSDI